jgi:hypothetical protein
LQCLVCSECLEEKLFDELKTLNHREIYENKIYDNMHNSTWSLFFRMTV